MCTIFENSGIKHRHILEYHMLIHALLTSNSVDRLNVMFGNSEVKILPTLECHLPNTTCPIVSSSAPYINRFTLTLVLNFASKYLTGYCFITCTKAKLCIPIYCCDS